MNSYPQGEKHQSSDHDATVAVRECTEHTPLEQRSCQSAHTPPNVSSTLAPRWHTALLMALILAVAATGTLLDQSRSNVDVGDVSSRGTHSLTLLKTYVATLLVQVAMIAYVARLGRSGWALGELLGRGWNTVPRAVSDVLLALAAWASVASLEELWLHSFRARQGAAIVAILPHARAETAAWMLVALSVGVSEELVYRGYLQAQMTAFTGRPAVAIIVQAALFGLAHGNQGLAAAFRIGVYAIGLGVLARARRSLVPGILCHVFTDVVAGLARA